MGFNDCIVFVIRLLSKHFHLKILTIKERKRSSFFKLLIKYNLKYMHVTYRFDENLTKKNWIKNEN